MAAEIGAASIEVRNLVAKTSKGNNVHNKGNLRENHSLNNNINDLKNTIMQNANKQLKVRGVQLPLAVP